MKRLFLTLCLLFVSGVVLYGQSEFPTHITDTVPAAAAACNEGNLTFYTTTQAMYVCHSNAWINLNYTKQTISTAAGGTTLGLVRGSLTESYAGTVSSGTMYAVRGDVSIGTGVTGGSGTYWAGVQGKAITGAGTVNTGAGYFTGVFGQLDVSSGTITSGHVAAIVGNTYGYNSGTSTILNNLYLEAAGGGVINAQIQTFGKATYVFDIITNTHTPEANTTCTPSAVTGTTGGIHVNVDGVARWIPLAATCT